MTSIPRVRTAVAALLLVAAGGSARAAEFYYTLIFGSQDSPKHLRNTHTWATFVRAVGEGPDPANYAIEAHTISWLPASLEVKVLELVPETGVNFDLEQSLRYVQGRGEGVTMWGPFRIGPHVYARSLEVRQMIESGAMQYRAISTARNLLISDCIHAVAAVDPDFGRGHYPLIRIGKPASRYMARQVVTRTRFDQDSADHTWLIPRLGLAGRGIEVVPPPAIPRRNCFLCRCPD